MEPTHDIETNERWFACLSGAEANARWNEIGPLLAPAVARSDDEMTIEDLQQQVIDGHMYVAVMGRGDNIVLALAMCVAHYPRKSVLVMAFIGGRQLQTFSLLYGRHIIDFARDIGCTDMEFHGDGMNRLLRPLGSEREARKVRTILRTEVN